MTCDEVLEKLRELKPRFPEMNIRHMYHHKHGEASYGF